MGTPHRKKIDFFRALPKLPPPPPPPPNSGKLYNFFWDVKNDVLMRITETSNNDYNNDWSDKGSLPFPIVQFFLGQVKFSHHSDKMFQRSKVSKISL